jgi:hypothetical protein
LGNIGGDWHKNGWFGIIENQINGNIKTIYEDGDAYIGLMRWKNGDLFEYRIGMFVPEGTKVPNGYEYHDFPKSILGVCWVYGNEGEVIMQEPECEKRLGEEGYKIITDGDGAYWFFERCVCPRFTTPDEKGKIILDICHYIE